MANCVFQFMCSCLCYKNVISKKPFLSIIIVLLPYIVFSQPGSNDLTFNPGTGTNNQVWAVTVQPDGKIILGGTFTSYNGTSCNNIVRINSDGSIDQGFNPSGSGANFTVWHITLQPDGKILIGGYFSTYNGVTRIRIARLNQNGTLDNTFNPGSGPNSQVYIIAVQPDGKILVGGNFTVCNGVQCNRLVRLNSNGSVDTGFDTQVGATDQIRAIVVQNDGKILIGGAFTSYNGISRNRYARLNSDGTLDTGFDIGNGFNTTVHAIAVQSDSKILAGGQFTDYNGTTSNLIARLNNDATIDTSFNPGSGANDAVRKIAVQNDGKIVVVGYFTVFSGVNRNSIVRLNPDASIDMSFDPGPGADNYMYSIDIMDNGRIVVGGEFTYYDWLSRGRVTRICNCTVDQPGNISGNTAVCQGSLQTYSITPVLGATSYTWSLPNGWSGNSDSISITTIAGNSGGVISVIANGDTCCNSSAQTLNITEPPIPNVAVCLVSVDSASTHNIIYWDKPITTVIDSFFIYREVTTNNFIKIASQPYDSLNEYHDYTANPNITSYKYKVSVLDTCNNESELSDYHHTIHLQNLGSGNLQWSLYDIENASNPVTLYRVYRDDFGTNDFSPISSTIPGGNATFTDVNYASFPSARYVVDVDWNIICSVFQTAVTTTRSNLRTQLDTTDGINEILENLITVYPNPADEKITIEFPSTMKISTVELVNTVGQIVYREPALPAAGKNNFSDKTKKQIAVEGFAEGVYTLCVYTNNGKVMKKVILQ